MNINKLLLKLIGRGSLDAGKLLIDLLKIKSISEDELKICNYVFKTLKGLGLRPHKIPVDKNGYVIIAKIGSPKVYLSSHIDTVPPFLPVRETPTYIYGRGASDAKGSVASMIVAAYEAKKEKLKDFGLIFTVGEETDFRGVKAFLKTKTKAPFVIIGEPTNMKVVNEHYGLIEFKFVAKSKEEYGETDNNKASAIDKLIDAVNIIDKAAETGTLFPKGSIKNTGLISGGKARAVVADYAEAWLDVTIPPHDKTKILKKVKELVGNLVSIKHVITIPWAAHKIPKELLFLKRKGVANHASDLSYFRNGIVLGPGSIHISHTSKEKIKKDQLIKAVGIYKQIIRNFQ